MSDKAIEIEGMNDLLKTLSDIPQRLKLMLKDSVDASVSNAAEDIKVEFKGGVSPGFKDRTGALRESIRGGVDEGISSDDLIVGFIGAGDDTVGSNGKQTREYVEAIEFGEFSRAGSTSFLRAGVQKKQRQIANDIARGIHLDELI